MVKRANIFIWGKVQGVFFRANIQKEARGLNLLGWVANEKDGSVNIMAQSEEENLKKLIDWCRSSPGFAKVDKIEVKWEKVVDELESFEIKSN